MPDLHDAREKVQDALARELVGPKPLGRPLDVTEALTFPTWEASRGPWHEAATGEEVLVNGLTPLRRYGVGVLFSATTPSEDERQWDIAQAAGVPGADAETPTAEDLPPGPDEKTFERLRTKLTGRDDDQDDDLDLTTANERRQSTLGVSVCGSFPTGSQLTVNASFGRYRPVRALIDNGAEQNWWVRSPVALHGVFPAETLAVPAARRREVRPSECTIEGGSGLHIEVRAFCRTVRGKHLITVTVTNRSDGPQDSASLFQAGFRATADGGAAFLPYPERENARELDPEEQSIALLYRRHLMFALGHGCAADWEREPGEAVNWVDAVCLPSFETPSITPDVELPEGPINVDMRALADPARQDEASWQIERLLSGYEAWIAARQDEASKLPEEHFEAAGRHLRDCRTALGRMRQGWRLITSNDQVATAFHLANRAMLDQQARSAAEVRETTLSQGTIHVHGEPPTGELPAGRGFWRPFQIAFLLATVESVAHPDSEFRDTVELIFFPTGGGKTEAYLAVAAFSMFLRRLRDPEDTGTEVVMRYTLRLLTAQQFLRAAALICAMDRIRDGRGDMGTVPFSIGVWLGGATTPNSQRDAIDSWRKLAKEPASAPNDFLLLRCPWCAAQLGPTTDQQKSGKRGDTSVIPGYVMNLRTGVTLACPDRHCPFHKKLPLLVVDDDIYDAPPSMVIGTVDKFAMLAWVPEARAIFGRDRSGVQVSSPPGLVIQDEFHLISGPLGSMVGMYEGIIERLCTDERGGKLAKPKIVSSTATIRRYEAQSRAVYARDCVALFPPPGLEASDSFFSVWARDKETGKLKPGRRYVGVHAPALRSMQSVQVRTAAALLQGAGALPDDERDPFWTGLWFFNSLRELGNTLSLLQSDIPDYLVALRQREGIDDIRFPRNIMELTGRRRNDEIPKAIDELSARYASGKAVDICLASNIIEVGVDIDRLSLMAVVGQPKTTSQYIQVSGRVGRRWQERPGLVVTLYGAAKPRDRSHYERFRTYHERLYAQVEPTSVTPFALPVMRRALHAALVAFVRLTGPEDLPPWPFPAELAQEAASILKARAAFVDQAEEEAAGRRLDQILAEWANWDRAHWKADPATGDPLNGLMRYAGTPAPGGQEATSWEVPSSMRNVDADCRATITMAYAENQAIDGAQK